MIQVRDAWYIRDAETNGYPVGSGYIDDEEENEEDDEEDDEEEYF